MANNYKQTVTGTIGAGMRSVFGGSGRKYYILEHKVSSQYHRAGETQEIIVDQIEIGRDSRCQVRFDESFSTVSRRHAAIVKSGDGWKLVQLSTTNKTFLNGVPVEREWYLQNGDEIQLSVNGPKLGFIVPQGNKSTVNTIGLSRRLSLFRQQALRPYKTAMTILSILLVLAIAAGTFFIVRGDKINNELRSNYDNAKKQLDSMAVEMGEMTGELSELKQKGRRIIPPPPTTDTTQTVTIEGSKDYAPYVYYIETLGYTIELDDEVDTFFVGNKVEFPDGRIITVDHWICTGFLLNNGKLVTARHCIEGWCYYQTIKNSPFLWKLNEFMNKGAKVNAIFRAYSPSGKYFTFTSNEVMCNRGKDHHYTTTSGTVVKIAGSAENGLDPYDFAWFNTNLKGGLAFDTELSNHLPLDTELEIYGYPHGWGAHSINDVHPIKGFGVVAKEGLENGIIMLRSASFDPGHSGSPVIYKNKDGKYIVVGICSAKTESFGLIVPISRVK